jgi:hypothetical protein
MLEFNLTGQRAEGKLISKQTFFNVVDLEIDKKAKTKFGFRLEINSDLRVVLKLSALRSLQ